MNLKEKTRYFKFTILCFRDFFLNIDSISTVTMTSPVNKKIKTESPTGSTSSGSSVSTSPRFEKNVIVKLQKEDNESYSIYYGYKFSFPNEGVYESFVTERKTFLDGTMPNTTDVSGIWTEEDHPNQFARAMEIVNYIDYFSKRWGDDGVLADFRELMYIYTWKTGTREQIEEDDHFPNFVFGPEKGRVFYVGEDDVGTTPSEHMECMENLLLGNDTVMTPLDPDYNF